MISGQSGHIVIGNVFYLADNATAAADGGVVTIPANVTVIAPGAFAQCAAAKELKFEGGEEGEENITYIGARAFNGSGIEAADEDGFIIVNGILARYTGRAETVVVPDEVRIVAPYAFGRGVKNIVFRSNSQLIAIEDNAFTNAVDLEKIASRRSLSIKPTPPWKVSASRALHLRMQTAPPRRTTPSCSSSKGLPRTALRKPQTAPSHGSTTRAECKRRAQAMR